jgi:hypothetical protein
MFFRPSQESYETYHSHMKVRMVTNERRLVTRNNLGVPMPQLFPVTAKLFSVSSLLSLVT